VLVIRARSYKMKKLIFAAMAAIFMAPALSSAAVLDFTTGTAGAGGTIVDTGTGDVQGMGILIDTLVAHETSADGVYNVDGGLACATGGGGSCAELSFDTAAGTFSIVGSVPGLVGPTTLLSGTIDSFTFGTASGGLATFFGTGTDTKAVGLLTSLGIAPDTVFSFAGFVNGVSGVPCAQGTCYQVTGADFLNNSGFGGEAIPEPTTLVLLGGGLLGLVRARKRRA
jgi:hypothetical protein